jgi:protocatechuate 3,4-dioxygenase beta subunit
MRLLVFVFVAFILFSPIASLSTAQPACPPARPDSEGPFYKPDAPERSTTGKGFVVTGTVKSVSNCVPVPQARIEWWSANPNGEYDDGHRATQRSDGAGRFRYETDFPGRYPGRPPHLHVRVTAQRHRTLVTQIYPKPGQRSMNFDFVLAPDGG